MEFKTKIHYFCPFLCFFLFSSQALAYLDPGTGSMMLQMIIGGVLAVIYTMKVYWRRIKDFFKKN